MLLYVIFYAHIVPDTIIKKQVWTAEQFISFLKRHIPDFSLSIIYFGVIVRNYILLPPCPNPFGSIPTFGTQSNFGKKKKHNLKKERLLMFIIYI